VVVAEVLLVALRWGLEGVGDVCSGHGEVVHHAVRQCVAWEVVVSFPLPRARLSIVPVIHGLTLV